MSLKNFHLIFIILSVGLALAMGAWAIGMYLSPLGGAGYLATALGSLLVAALLAVYAVTFVRKTRRAGIN